jgi:hypothetical protein
MDKKNSNNKMDKKNQKYILFLLIIIILIFEIIFLIKLSKSRIDKIIIVLCIISQINIIYSIQTNNSLSVFISHILFVLSVMIIPIVSSNIWLLISNIVILIITLIFRKINSGCPITTFDKDINCLGDTINWDIVYSIIGIITIIKIWYVKKSK